MRLTQTHYEIIKFVIVGGINTLNYYIVYLLLLKLLNVNYLVSHVRIYCEFHHFILLKLLFCL